MDAGNVSEGCWIWAKLLRVWVFPKAPRIGRERHRTLSLRKIHPKRPRWGRGSILTLTSLGSSCRDGVHTVAARGTAAPPRPPRATASSPCHCVLPGGFCPFLFQEMKVWHGLVLLQQLRHLRSDAPPCAGGTWVDPPHRSPAATGLPAVGPGNQRLCPIGKLGEGLL